MTNLKMRKDNYDEYQPSPVPQATSCLPSLEVPVSISVTPTNKEIAAHAMAQPILWISAW
ncbi:hypothetical protein BDR04DRAFT_1165143 [Suillus decipiens]|nr:hypothetical protein BDR04DRAFT_1165143 [Suillus decipiens]